MRLSLTDQANFPDFLIVGAAKCGTSSLHRYLDAHPDIFMPENKELLYWHINRNPNQAIFDVWDRNRVPTTLIEYLSNFEKAKVGQLVGEACPSYLYYHDYTIQTLKERHPGWRDLKIIVILRDPVARIISEFRFVRRNGLDPDSLSLEEALGREQERLKENRILADNFYMDVTRYADQIEHYKREFQHVKVYLYDDLKADSEALVRDLCDYLGMSPDKLPPFDSKIYNKSGPVLIPRTRMGGMIHQFAYRLRKSTPVIRRLKMFRPLMEKALMSEEVIPENVIQELSRHYLPELDRLEKVTGLDLSLWKERYKNALAQS